MDRDNANAGCAAICREVIASLAGWRFLQMRHFIGRVLTHNPVRGAMRSGVRYVVAPYTVPGGQIVNVL